jgi:hypothetical protein
MKPFDGGDGADRLLRRSVTALNALAARIEEIATVVEIPVDRLQAEFRAELDTGLVLRKAALLTNLDAAATGRNRRIPHVGALLAILRRLDATDGTIRPRARRR